MRVHPKTLGQCKSKQSSFGALTAIAILLVGCLARSQAQLAVPTAQVVWQHVGRVYLNPNTGQALWAGYLVHINGINSSLFNGAPSEATAYFTFSTDVLSLTPMPNNGDMALSLVSAGTFNVYYNNNPDGDWSNPASFTRLQSHLHQKRELVARIRADRVSQSFSFLSSQSFTFNGQTYNFNHIAPYGITFAQFLSTTPLTGVTDYPVAFAGTGTTIAVGNNRYW